MPNSSTSAFINNGGTALVSSAGASALSTYLGQGNLTVQSGGSLSGTNLKIGASPFSSSFASATPANANIQTGGTVSVTFLELGAAGNATGNLTIDGSGSSLTASTRGLVDNAPTAGTGSITVQNGGAFSAGYFLGNSGSVTVTGSGSTFAMTNSSQSSQFFNLTIQNGGSVTSAGTDVGIGWHFSSPAQSPSTTTVTGSSSSLTALGNLTIESTTVAVSSGATVSIDGSTSGSHSGTVFLGNQVNGGFAGTLQIGSGASSGTFNAAQITFENSASALVFNHTDSSYTFSPTLVSAANGGSYFLGAVTQQGSGTTVLTGDSSSFAGTVTVSAGKLIVNNTLGISTAYDTFTVASGGTLGGTGTLKGVVNVNSGGTLAPGNSPGLLAITGSLTLSSGSFTAIELGGTTRGSLYDAINVSGALTFGGTLNVALYGGFNPSTGQSFDLFDWGSQSGTFASLNLPSLTSGLSWDTSALYTTGIISVTGTAIPEPTTCAAMFGVVGLVFAADRRRKLAARRAPIFSR